MQKGNNGLTDVEQLASDAHDTGQRMSEVPATVPSASGRAPISTRRRKPVSQRANAPRRPRWLAKFAAAVFVLVMLMLIGAYFYPPDQARRPIVVIFCGFGMGVVFALIQGDVSIKFKLPFLPKSPVAGSAAGGMGAFVLTCVLVNLIFPKEPSVKSVVQPGGPPTPFDLRLTTDRAPKGPNIDFVFVNARSECLAYQARESRYDIRNIPMPAPGGRIEASFRPVVEDSLITGGTRGEQLSPFRHLCLTTNQTNPKNRQENFAAIRCPSDPCSVDDQDPGWVSACQTTAVWRWPALIPEAYAASPADPPRYWISSSLRTLQARHAKDSDQPPFMHFRLKAKSRAALPSAKFFEVGISVNGTPVYINGWRPGEYPIPLAGSRDIDWEFALQNLGFEGAQGGFEVLSVQVQWLDGDKQALSKTRLERKMVAFRDVEEETSTTDVAEVTLSGEYQPSPRFDRFSIMLGSPRSEAEALGLKQRIDAAQQTLQNDRIIAVVRPPLKPWRLQNYANPSYSVLLGLVKGSGQVAFAFDEASANDVCRAAWVNRDAFKGAMHKTVLRYEWPIPGAAKDAGRDRYRLCSEL